MQDPLSSPLQSSSNYLSPPPLTQLSTLKEKRENAMPGREIVVTGCTAAPHLNLNQGLHFTGLSVDIALACMLHENLASKKTIRCPLH